MTNMRLVNAKHTEWGEPLLLVDQIPPLETLRFRKLRVNDPAEPRPPDVDPPTNPGYLYVAEQDGYVAALLQDDSDHPWYGQGSGGAQLRLHLDDGTAETLVGPWPASSDLVNRYLPELAAHNVRLTDDRRSFEDEDGKATVEGAITMQLWDEIPSLVRSADKQARQPLLRLANPGRLGVEQIAQITARAVQQRVRDPDNPLPEGSIVEEEVARGVEGAVAGFPPRPDVDVPDVRPGTVATDVVHEYLQARQEWGWPVGRASAWAVGEVVDRLRTSERIGDAAVRAAWAVSERQEEADRDVILDLHQSLEDRTAAAREVWEAQDAEPWLPVDAIALLAAAPPADKLPTELTERARMASNRDLLGWMSEALQQSERPLVLGMPVAWDGVARVRSHVDEERAVLRGLRRELAEAGAWWWPANWARRADLRARVAARAELVAILDKRTSEAEERVSELRPRAQEAQRAWQRRHRRVLERAAVSVEELRRREEGLLDDRVADPPEHLLEALGPVPSDMAGRQAWRAQALELERARAGKLGIEEVAARSAWDRASALGRDGLLDDPTRGLAHPE
jgi:hypothetical protein